MIFSELFQLKNNLKMNFFYFTTFKWEGKTSLTAFCKFTAEGPLSEHSTSNVNCSPSFKDFRPEFLTAEK